MSEYIKTVEDFVKDHIDEKITLKMMSDCVYLSQFHFSRKFKKGNRIVTQTVCPADEDCKRRRPAGLFR